MLDFDDEEGRSFLKTEYGYTLAELVVVIAIVGILSAVLIPAVSGNIQKGRFATDLQNLRVSYMATSMYRSPPPIPTRFRTPIPPRTS
jgi:prepilin-type N-terminal cleavage/methylation domain-containing protein